MNCFVSGTVPRACGSSSVLILALWICPASLFGCKCGPLASVCEAFSSSDLVFAGRVESIEPDFEPWSSAKRLNDRFSDGELARLEKEDSPEALRKLQDIYVELVPEPFKSQIAATSSLASIEAVLVAMMANGKRFRFHVDEVFKGTKTNVLDVWTDYSGCAGSLSNGETYLIYASRDEDGRFATHACS
ncbi:MAG: hypothetical protein EXQ52_14145, partial [Bryobacterales bacterium]|nr:hypothetical protein [Bryobacterales bacterium]